MTEFDSKYIVGIDEVGRGPLAGPVAIGIVLMEMGEYKKLLAENIFVAGKDSKKLSPKKRLENFSVIKKLGDEKRLEWGVFFEDNQTIDKYGIVGALNMAIAKGCRSLSCLPEQAYFLLDGGLKAPVEFINQESIIRGDESELVISLASIVAKVMRDAKMTALATEYEDYAFAENMGYGTAKHIEALKKFGPSPIHRRSFITRWCS